MSHEPNIAVIESKVFNLETVIHDIIKIQHDQATINGNLEKTIALLQQSHSDFIKRYDFDDSPKLKTLWENRSSIKGGWLVLVSLGNTAMAMISIIGVIYVIVKGLKQ